MRGKRARKIRKEARKFMRSQWVKVGALSLRQRIVLAFYIVSGTTPDAWRIIR